MPVHLNSYRIICDSCHGRKFIGSQMCSKCGGEGTFEIDDEPLTFSQVTAKKAAKIIVAAVFLALVTIAAMHFFGVI